MVFVTLGRSSVLGVTNVIGAMENVTRGGRGVARVTSCMADRRRGAAAHGGLVVAYGGFGVADEGSLADRIVTADSADLRASTGSRVAPADEEGQMQTIVRPDPEPADA